MGMGMGVPAQKSKDFRGSFRRLLGQLRPEAPRILLVLILALGSVAFAILGPKLLGAATNIIYDGVVGRQLPAGVTQDQVIAGLRAQGQDQLADQLSSLHLTPGAGVDFTALAQVLLVLAGLYVERGLRLDAGLHHGWRHATERVPAARTRRSQARAPSAPILR
jgi:ATP-binding cassette subfamily B protein